MLLEKKYLQGKCYWYASEKKRVHGRVKRIFQTYLGSQDQCLRRLLGNDPSPRPPTVLKDGAVMAWLHVAQALGGVELMDHYMGQQPEQDTRVYNPHHPPLPSRGTYLLLAAMHRGIASTSQRDLDHWCATTSLKRRWPAFTPHRLSSQWFWEAMQVFHERHVGEMTHLITERVFQVYGDMDRSCLLVDETNYYPFIDTLNQSNTLAQRGNHTHHRNNLRQVGSMLLVTHESHIPVFYLWYQGKHTDSTVFKTHLAHMSKTAKRLTPGADVTVVFDTGNVSTAVMKLLPEELACVTSLIPSHQEDLLQASVDPLECLRPTSQEHEEILAYGTTKKLWGTDQKIVIGDSPSFFKAHTQSLLWQIHTAETQLQAIQQALSGAEASQTGRPRSVAEIRSRVDKIVHHDHLHQFMTYTISGRRYMTVTFQLDEETLQEYIRLYYGQTIPVTKRTEWSALDIIQTYREQAMIEACMKETKGMKHSLWWPMGHWTDQKIYVQGFYTFLAFLLKAVVPKKLQAHGIRRSWHAVVSELDEMYAVVDLAYEQGHLVARMRFSTMNEPQEELFRVLL